LLSPDERIDMQTLMKWTAAAAAALALAGCAPMVAQSPGQGLSPVNAVADAEDKHLMLFGTDVVSYFTDGRDQPGNPAIKSVVKGVTFRFASAEHKRMFDAAPEKYMPQFGGYCTNGIVYAVPWGGNVNSWTMIDGKLYMFGGKGSMDAFMLRPKENMALANKYWAEEVEGSNAFWQRTKRTTFARVPHYRSGQELADEVAAAKAAKR
jgi:YHS domain-containing protein